MTRWIPALLLIAGACAHAEQKWIKATTSNFELLTTASEKRARETLLRFEQVRGFFAQASGARPRGKGRVRIIAFDSEREFKPYRINEGTTAWAGGEQDRDQIVMSNISPESYPVAVHEYVHVLLKPVRQLPLWFNEGLAEVYSTLTPYQGKARFGDPPVGRLYTLRETKMVPLEVLFSVDHQSPLYNEKDKQRVFYAESWKLAHMLSLDQRYRPRFGDFYHQLALGTKEPEALQKAFGKTVAEVMKDLQGYMERTFSAALVDVKLERSAEEVQVNPATPVETGIALAGAFAAGGKRQEAIEAYRKLEASFPAEPQIPDALGYLEWRNGSTDGAREQFAKAAARGSENPRLYFDYAGLLEGTPDCNAKRIPLLRKALELDRDFREARLNLAYTLMAQEDYQGALVQFAYIHNTPAKEAFQLFYSMAYAHFRTGRKADAKIAAQRALEQAQTPGERSTVDGLLEALADRPVIAGALDNDKTPASAAPVSAPGTLPQPAARPAHSVINGTLDNVECTSGMAVVRVRSGTHTTRLLIRDPNLIEIRGTGGYTYEFTCGPQRGQPVLIEYDRAVDGKLATTGLVRAIEFKK